MTDAIEAIPYLRTDSAAEAHAKGQAAARGGIPRRAPTIYSREQRRAWLWGWDTRAMTDPDDHASPVDLEEAAYQRDRLRLEAARIGPNAYSDYLLKHGKRPDKATAATIGRLLGGRVRADDGKMYPPLTNGEKQALREQKARREKSCKEYRDANAFVTAVDWLADIKTDPETMVGKLGYNPRFPEPTISQLDAAAAVIARMKAFVRRGKPENDA